MIENMRFNNHGMEFEHDDRGITHRWMRGDISCLWVSPKTARVYVKKGSVISDGKTLETYFLHQDPKGRIYTYLQGGMLSRDRESDFLGRRVWVCPAQRAFFPPELSEILDHVENKWGWAVDPEIRTLLAQARS